MTFSDLGSLVPAILVPVVTAVVGALGLQLQDWQRRRSRAARKRAVMDDANKQVAFVSQWWDATSSVVTSPEELAQLRGQARRWLDEAASLAMESKPAPVEEPEGGTIRRLLLLVPLDHSAARRLRVVFFLFLGVWAIVIGGTMRDTLADRGYLAGDLIAVVILGALSTLLRFWAVSVEGTARPGAAPRPRMEHILLLYPLRHWWPRTVRVLFYALVMGTAAFLVYAVKDALRHPTRIPLLVATAGVLIGYCIGLSRWVVASVPPTGATRAGRLSAWLLLYPFRTRRGMATRAAFYVVLVLGMISILFFATDLSSGADSTTKATGLRILISLALAALVLQRWAVVSESAAAGPRPRIILDRILLIYRLQSRTAKITRVGFYLAVVILAGYAIGIVVELLYPATDVTPTAPREAGIALAVSAALWACTILLDQRRIAALRATTTRDQTGAAAVARGTQANEPPRPVS